jgi:hypothetical protein
MEERKMGSTTSAVGGEGDVMVVSRRDKQR